MAAATASSAILESGVPWQRDLTRPWHLLTLPSSMRPAGPKLVEDFTDGRGCMLDGCATWSAGRGAHKHQSRGCSSGGARMVQVAGWEEVDSRQEADCRIAFGGLRARRSGQAAPSWSADGIIASRFNRMLWPATSARRLSCIAGGGSVSAPGRWPARMKGAGGGWLARGAVGQALRS